MSERDEAHEHMALAQGDIAVNLFMVLVVVLAAVLILASVAVATGFRVTLAPERGRDAPLALVRGWSPVQPVRIKLLIRNGQVFRLDFRAFAAAVAEGKSIGGADPVLDDRSMLLVDDDDIGAHRVDFQFDPEPGAVLPDEVVLWRAAVDAFSTNTPPAAAALELAETVGVELFFVLDDAADAWEVARWLHTQRTPMAFRPQRAVARVRYERRSEHFTFEEIYK